MRKFLIGMVLGAVLVLPVAAHAHNTLPQGPDAQRRIDALCRALVPHATDHEYAWHVACASEFRYPTG